MPIWTLESRWFDVAAFAMLAVVLTVIFGRFEEYKPAWRRLAKLAFLLLLLLGLIEVAGRAWAYAVLSVLFVTGGAFHFTLLARAGINGFTGEPRDRFDALLRDVKANGEARTFWKLARSLRPAPNGRPKP